MANSFLDKTGLTYLWGKLKSYFVKGNARVFVGTCSTDAVTWTKQVVCPDFTASDLVPGTIISVIFTSTNTAAVGNIKLSVNETEGKSIKYIYNGSLSNIPGAGYIKANQMYQFYYDGTYWVVSMNYNTNSNDLYKLYYTHPIAGPGGLKQYSLIMQLPDGRFSSFTTTHGTGTTKPKNTVGFVPGKILYRSASGNLDENVASGNDSTRESSYLIDLRYSGNQGSTLVANKPVYLVGTIGGDGLFYLADSWFTQTLPTSDDGKVYYYLGGSYDTYRIDFDAYNPCYQYKNGRIRLCQEDSQIDLNTVEPLGFTDVPDRGWCLVHMTSGVTAKSAGDTSNQTPGFGDTFKALSGTVNDMGHLTALNDHTVTIPDAVATQNSAGLMSDLDKTKLDKIGIYYANGKNLTLAASDIDALTAGASITIPKGVYVMIASWNFGTRTTSGTTNSAVCIQNGSNSVIAQTRVFAATNNWNRLEASAIVEVSSSTETFKVAAATTRAYTTAQYTKIAAIRIA